LTTGTTIDSESEIGTQTATLSGEDGAFTDTLAIEVVAAAIEELRIEPESTTVAEGETVQLEAVALYSNGQTITRTHQTAWFVQNTGSTSHGAVSNEDGFEGRFTGLHAGGDPAGSCALKVLATYRYKGCLACVDIVPR
jgi:hypothetical protein